MIKRTAYHVRQALMVIAAAPVGFVAVSAVLHFTGSDVAEVDCAEAPYVATCVEAAR